MIFGKQMKSYYEKTVCVRFDGEDGLFYFSAADFPGLQQIPHAFSGSAGQKLQGYFYSYGTPNPDRLVVFDHGLGAGHRAYMKEIELIARQGYLVFAYDHTGCVESGGETTNGMVQSLNDLNQCIREMKSLENVKDRNIAVIGHSWGGFSTMNIGAIHQDITHLVPISGFISIGNMLKQQLPGVMALYRKLGVELETERNPEFVAYSGVESLKNTKAKVLVIHGDDDPVVKKKFHFDVLKKELDNRKNITFFEVSGKGHCPHYTEDAARYKDAFFKNLSKEKNKKALLAEADWDRMTAQDEEIWKVIFRHLES